MDTDLCCRSNGRCSDCLWVENSEWERWQVAWRNVKVQVIHLIFVRGGPKQILIHTQQNAMSYVYMHQHIPDQTKNMTRVHSDSNTSHLISAACVASRHSVIGEERSLCLCGVIINSLCLSKWSRRSQCCKESTCINSAEARSFLAWLPLSLFPKLKP